MKYLSALSAALISVPLFCVVARGAGIVRLDPMSFGTVELHPSGADIVLDAREKETTPRCMGRSLVFNGHSGLLALRSSVAEEVWIDYPEKVILRRKGGGTKIELTEMARWSRFGEEPFRLRAGEEVDVSVGGRLTAPGDLDVGRYSGDVVLEVFFQ